MTFKNYKTFRQRDEEERHGKKLHRLRELWEKEDKLEIIEYIVRKEREQNEIQPRLD